MFSTELTNAIKEALVGRKETIAAAESVTAGLVQAALATAENASFYFQGGLTAYNLGQKCRHLDVDPIVGEQCNAVSEKVAEQMAVGVCRRFTATWGIGITGYATPVPESEGRRFAYFAIAYRAELQLCQRVETGEEDARKVQIFYVETILEALRGLLTSRPSPF